ncbi:MAG TPA: FAD-dependent oxidoreductase [Polyangia bacterium]|jgi:protoporphyrinogen oxidase
MGRVVVIGAGVTGLRAARRLAEAGADVQVLEAEAEPGGLCRSVRLDGCLFDLGPHFIHDVTARRIGLEDACVPVMLFEAIRLGGRSYQFPFGLLARPRYLPPLALAYARRLLRGLPEGSLEARLRGAYGAAFYDEVMAPLLGKWLGAELAEISPVLARRFDPPDPRVLLFHLKVRLLRRHSDYFHQQRQYVYPQGGMAALVARMAAGLDVRGNARVERILVDAGRVRGVRVGGATVACDAVVSTAPAGDLTGLLAGAAGAPRGLVTTRGVVFVLMVFDQPRVTRHLWTWFPEPRAPLYRLSEMPNLAPTRAGRQAAGWPAVVRDAAPAGATAVMAEICVGADDPRWSPASDAALVAECVARVQAEYGVRGAPRATRVMRAAGAYPGFRLDERAAWEHPAQLGIAGLVVAGRAAEHRYYMVEHALDAGERAAREVLAARR